MEREVKCPDSEPERLGCKSWLLISQLYGLRQEAELRRHNGDK